MFVYLDKFVLVYLNAREVIDTDEQRLFQKIKNEVYKTTTPIPKVYLCNASHQCCFILASRNSWSIVIDKNLLRKMSESELEMLTEFLFRFKAAGNPLIQTKVMGMSVLLLALIYAMIKNIFKFLFWIIGLVLMYTICFGSTVVSDNPSRPFVILTLFAILLVLYNKFNLDSKLNLAPQSRGFAVLSLFLISLAKPLINLLEYMGKSRSRILASRQLGSVVAKVEVKPFSFDKFLVNHLRSDLSVRSLILNYIESYPALENCYFEKNEL